VKNIIFFLCNNIALINMSIIISSIIICIIIYQFKKIKALNKNEYRADSVAIIFKIMKYVAIGFILFNCSLMVLFMAGILITTTQGYNGIIIIIGIVVFLTLSIKLYITLKNRSIIKESNSDEIYIRDIPSEFSPAVISYLYNQKIERKKDVTATILKLCSKKVISFETQKENTIIFKDLKNTTANITEDEKYIYNWITKDNQKKYNFNEWEKIIKSEYYKCGFSRINNIDIAKITFTVGFLGYFCMFISLFVISILGGTEIFEKLNIGQYVLPALIIPFALAFFTGIYKGVEPLFKRNKDKDSIYTRKGAAEIARWRKFENYIKDYTLIKDTRVESIIIFERYLAYAMVLGINKSYDELEFNELNKFLKVDLVDFMDNYINAALDNQNKESESKTNEY